MVSRPVTLPAGDRLWRPWVPGPCGDLPPVLSEWLGKRELRWDYWQLVGSFREMVALVLSETTPGDVLTYGEVARLAGHPGAARAVGRVLATSSGLPWWRVVTASGRLVPGLEAEQSRRLEQEIGGGLEKVSRPADGAAGPGPAWPCPENAPVGRARSRRFPR